MIPPKWRFVTKGDVSFWILDPYCTMEFGHVNSVDFWTLFERNWELETFRILDQFLDHNSSFVDVGAWVGPMSIYASFKCRQVYSIEPDFEAFKLLQAHVMENRISNINLLNVAISQDGNFLRLGHKKDGYFGDSMTSVHNLHNSFISKCVPLESVIPIDCSLIKMDIEGYEDEVLADFDLPCTLWVSTHEDLSPSPRDYRKRLESFLKRYPNHQRIGDDILVKP